MAISSKALVEFILLGPVGDRRQWQDSTILGDMCMDYALEPRKCYDLRIIPDWHHPPGKVAARLAFPEATWRHPTSAGPRPC